jgi:hypothetical protein
MKPANSVAKSIDLVELLLFKLSNYTIRTRIDKTYYQDRTSSEPPRRRPRLALVPGVIVPPPPHKYQTQKLDMNEPFHMHSYFD